MKAHLVGGGIASLAAAAHLIRDAGLRGSNIFLYEASGDLGGTIDATGSARRGYSIRGGRMLEDRYLCAVDLLSSIPAIQDLHVSVAEDMEAFRETATWFDLSLQVGTGGRVLDAGCFGLATRERIDLAALAMRPESSLDGVPIGDCFQPAFFRSRFWLTFSTLFGFTPWHGAVEMRRYLHGFLDILPTTETLTVVRRTRYCQYESIVRPLVNWLRQKGVRLRTGTRVTGIDFADAAGITASRLHLESDGGPETVELGPDQLVLVTLGSKTSHAARGSMTEAPRPEEAEGSGAWALWQSLARDFPQFGNPAAFRDAPDRTAWESFTVTEHGRRFFDRLEALTNRPAGRAGMVTLPESNWLISFAPLRHPHFMDQPDGVEVWWGDGLYVDRPGNFVAKPMTDCTGAEILEEVVRHLGFAGDLEAILRNSICIPYLMPYGMSAFMPRRRGDRPPVIPAGSVNLAFIGPYVELPEEPVSLVEYSVRSARLAIAGLVPGVAAPPDYHAEHDRRAIYDSLKALQG
jgi:oleate hydratase